MRAARLLLTGALAAALGGCALKSPPPREDLAKQAMPNLTLPEKWVAGGMPGAVPAEAGPGGAPWLAAFGGPQLTALGRGALLQKLDLQGAAARVEAAARPGKSAGAAPSPHGKLPAR